MNLVHTTPDPLRIVHAFPLNQLAHGLKLAEIEINRKVLADIAVNDPEGFKTLVEAAKGATA